MSLHKDGLARVLRRAPLKRRWAELTLLSLRQSYGIVVHYLTPSVGLRGSDPFLCALVASRRAL